MVVSSSISAPAKGHGVGLLSSRYQNKPSASFQPGYGGKSFSESSVSTRADDRDGPETVVDRAALWRAIAAAGVGNFMEYYDLAVYGYVAGQVGRAFFPESDSGVQRLEVFASMALAFAARPIGSLITGPLGDKIGRRRMLTYTVAITSLSTGLCGCIPTYSAIGFWSPLLLILFRLLQAGAASGEYAGAGTFIAEYSPSRSRGLYCSLSVSLGYMGPVTGSLLNLILTTCASESFYEKYGWRILFLMGVPFGLLGLILRQMIEETPVYLQMEQSQTTSKRPLRDVLADKRALWRVFLGFCIAGIETGPWFVMLSFMPSFLTDVQQIDSTWTTVVVVFAQLVAMAAIPCAGRLSDFIGRRRSMTIACILYLALPSLAMYMVTTAHKALIVCAFILLGACLGVGEGNNAAVLPEMFESKTRLACYAIAYNLSAMFFGGLGPVVVTAVQDATDSDYIPSFFLMIIGLIVLAAIWMIPETKGIRLRDVDMGAHGGADGRMLSKLSSVLSKDPCEDLDVELARQEPSLSGSIAVRDGNARYPAGVRQNFSVTQEQVAAVV